MIYCLLIAYFWNRYYYQYRENRLSACPLTIHGLLHIADNIRFCGPVWTAWTFYLERYCGFLSQGLHSKRQPWSNLNKRVLHMAYLGQLAARYDLDDELSSPSDEIRGQLSCKERIYDKCTYASNVNMIFIKPTDWSHLDPMSILQVPFYRQYHPSDILRKKIAGYFSSVLQTPRKDIIYHLPTIFSAWGKVRIANGGDSVRSSRIVDQERDSSYVRVSSYFILMKLSFTADYIWLVWTWGCNTETAPN